MYQLALSTPLSVFWQVEVYSDLCLVSFRCCDKQHHQTTWGSKCLLAYRLQSDIRRSQSKNLRRVPGGRNLESRTREGHCLLTGSHGLLGHLFIWHWTTCPEMALPIVGWILLHKLLIKKMFHKHAHGKIFWRHVLNWDSFLPRDSSLCQAYKNQLAIFLSATKWNFCFICCCSLMRGERYAYLYV